MKEFDELKSEKAKNTALEINEIFSFYLKRITSPEIASLFIQKSELDRLAENSEASTPFINRIVEISGITKAEVISRLEKNLADFSAFSAILIGEKYRIYKNLCESDMTSYSDSDFTLNETLLNDFLY